MTGKGKRNPTKKKDYSLMWFVILTVLPLVFIVAFSLCQSLWTDANLGFFYLAGYSLLIMSAFYACFIGLAKFSHATKRGRKVLVASATIGVIVLLVVPILVIDNSVRSPHNVFLTEYRNNNKPNDPTQLSKFMNDTMDGKVTADILRGYNITLLFSNDPIAHGILGIIFGGVAMAVTYIGWYSKPKENDKGGGKDSENEIAKVVFNFNIVLSIIFAVTILATGNPILMSSVRYAFIITSLILAVLLFTLGFLISSETQTNGSSFLWLFMALVVSFTVGFVVGNMVFPVTRVEIGNFRNKPLYGVYPGQYVFMCASMLWIAFSGLVLADQQSNPRQTPTQQPAAPPTVAPAASTTVTLKEDKAKEKTSEEKEEPAKIGRPEEDAADKQKPPTKTTARVPQSPADSAAPQTRKRRARKEASKNQKPEV